MNKELDALHKNNTWDMVDLPPGQSTYRHVNHTTYRHVNEKKNGLMLDGQIRVGIGEKFLGKYEGKIPIRRQFPFRF